MFRSVLIWLFFFSLILTACKREVKNVGQSGTDIRSDAELYFDSLEFIRLLDLSKESLVYRENVIEFYRNRNFRFTWINRNGPTELAAQLINLLRDANEDVPGGLLSLDRIEGIYRQLTETDHRNGEVDTLSGNADILFTAAYFEYADKVYAGLPDEVCRNLEWYIPRKKLLYAALLDSVLLQQPELISSSLPVFHMYHKLRQDLFSYSKMDRAGVYELVAYPETIPAKGDSLEILAQIKRNLILLSDMSPGDTSEWYTQALEEAVFSFRSRMGLAPEAGIDSAFISEMNVPLRQRMQTILLNMERCRWLPVSEQQRFIVINLPDFSLMLFKDRRIAWRTRVIIGEANTKTVVFTSALKYIVFSPYWNIPASIVSREIIPSVLRDPEYLVKHRMEIVEFSGMPLGEEEAEFNWTMFEGRKFPYLIRQLPGADNALGRVKFLFPNNYSMYLHDTPSQELFRHSSRAFSHGCIRVENPDRLAAALLAGDSLWTEEKIAEAMNSGKEKWIMLSDEVPVFIVYFTSWVDEKGSLQFRNDIYGHDARLAEVLFENLPED